MEISIINILLLFTIGLSFYFIRNIIHSLRNKSKYYAWHIVNLSLNLFLIIFGISMHDINQMDIHFNATYYILLYFIVCYFIMLIIDLSGKIIFNLEKDKNKFYIEKKKFENDNIMLLVEAEHKTTELEVKVGELEDTKRGMLNMLEDINEQKDRLQDSEKKLKKLTKELHKANTEIMSLDKQKDQFTSITAHELKTPLASIHGFVQLLKNQAVIEDPTKRNNYMNIILHDTERLSKLISDILDISRMDLGTLKFYFENMDVKEFIKKTENEMSSIFKSKNIKYSFTIEKDVPKTIFADPNRLSQILTNLINNAVHYSPENSKISVNVKKSGKNVEISVKDNGPGIPKKHIKNIFERFYQVDGWLTRKIGGSGLGLSICKGLVEAMEGKIGVISEEGKGSTFYFTIPFKQKEKFEKYLKIFKDENNKDN